MNNNDRSLFVRCLIAIGKLLMGTIWLILTMFTLGLSLLPLTALIIGLPLVSPNEAVLTQTVQPARSFLHRLIRRIFALFAAIFVCIALLAISVQFVSLLPLPSEGRLAAMAKKILNISLISVDDNRVFNDFRKGIDELPKQTMGMIPLSVDLQKKWKLTDKQIRAACEPLYEKLPSVMVEHWPFILLTMYVFDLILLLSIGKVPLGYNLRNLLVRWMVALLTALAFTVVVALVVVLLAFVNGMYELNNGTGVPGNVIVLSEGSTDEVFSNLGYGDVDNIPTTVIKESREGGIPISPISIKSTTGIDGKPTFLMSKEIYYTVNQSIDVVGSKIPRKRFLQLRAMYDAKVSGEVHNVDLSSGQWFDQSGVIQKNDAEGKPRTYIQAVLGDGSAKILGEDFNKPSLVVNDTFKIGDLDLIVVGVLKSEGKTFGSEIWVQITSLITKPFGKDRYTTLVMRTNPETEEAAKEMVYFLQYKYDQQKLKAFSELEYYKSLTQQNETFLSQIIFLAIVMAIGGVFGVMNTMFASISARIKEVGVLRILGFKRWQILISFMLESLAIAFVGGVIGCLIAMFFNGVEAQSTLGGQGGGGKRVLLRLIVDYQTIAAGILFTLAMGRIGGLVPALSAMRMKVLDTLR